MGESMPITMDTKKKLEGKVLNTFNFVSSATFYPDAKRVMLDVRGKEVWIDDVDILTGAGNMMADTEYATVDFEPQKAVCREIEAEPIPALFRKSDFGLTF